MPQITQAKKTEAGRLWDFGRLIRNRYAALQLITLKDLEPLKTCLGRNKKCEACGFDANSLSGPIEAAPQTGVSASKMLHHARMSAMAGRTAAFRVGVERRLWCRFLGRHMRTV
jgi:hypothetical protein